MQEMSFEYGGYHFIPERQFTKREDDFFKITRRLKTDKELGFFAADYYGKGSQKFMMIFMLHPRIRNAIFSAAWRTAGCTSPASMNCSNI